MSKRRIHFHIESRAEIGMMAPVLRRWLEAGHESVPLEQAQAVLIPGDRREAMRKALEAYERDIPIIHLGSGDSCDGDGYHYDGIYRTWIAEMAHLTHGWQLGLGDHARYGCDDIVGPTMTDDLPAFHGQSDHVLVMYNPLPWDREDLPDIQGRVLAMEPGNDYGREAVRLTMRRKGWEVLPDMPRPAFLELLATAREVWGNSSALCYEAPLWHEDKDIHFIGLRNMGRQIVRWEGSCPSDNAVKAILSHLGWLEDTEPSRL